MIVHGHRGCRGTFPENVTVGFVHATLLGVDYLELDVVCTGDQRILVSHEPYMLHEICTLPDGKLIEQSEERSYNIYRMTTDEVQSFPVGTFSHSRFPKQQLVKTHKPLLKESVEAVRKFAEENQLNMPGWNIELKSDLAEYGVFQPDPETYAKLFLDELYSLKIDKGCMLQSFDIRLLWEIHQKAPELKLVFLSEDPKAIPEKQLKELGFKPFAYSPNYLFINKDLAEWCRNENLELIAWTVNDMSEIERLYDLGINHIITDYPEEALALKAAKSLKDAKQS